MASVAGETTFSPAKLSVSVASSLFVPARQTVTVPPFTAIGDALVLLFTFRYRFEIVNESSSVVEAEILTSPAVSMPETTQSPFMYSVFDS